MINKNENHSEENNYETSQFRKTSRFNLTLLFNSATAIFLLLWIFLTHKNQLFFEEALSASFIIVSILIIRKRNNSN